MIELPSRFRIGTAAVVVCASAVVVVLGVLQYRWNQEASDATGVRLADALQLSMINWHLDLFRNLSEIGLMMRSPAFATRNDADRYMDRLEEWRTVARYPQLVANAYIVRRGDEGQEPEVVQVAPAGPVLTREHWPPVINRVVSVLEQAKNEHRPKPVENPQLSESFYNIGSALRVWQFEPYGPALVNTTTPEHEWIVVELDARVLQERILPDLAHRYFQGIDGLDYEVAVVSGTSPRRVLYTSDPGFGARDVGDADGTMDVFGRFSGSESSVSVFHRTTANSGPTAAVGVRWFPLLEQSPVADDWQLVVRHRRGAPLGAFVTQMRQRGLIVSFTALLVLVLSVSMLLVSTIRAQRLARLQMDFVTGVSHELRTPLAIIGSAADNITNGVVETPEQLHEYGSAIGHEVGQLSELVERILLFASTRTGRQEYVLEPLDPAQIVETVLAGTSNLIHAAHFTVERDIQAGLPPVLADRFAVSQCLENLVTNALKYGKDARWMRLRAVLARGDHGDEIQISVTDRGIGIDEHDLPRIFEPFYRSRGVQLAQIHGTGLGLTVARQLASAVRGTLTVTSTPGKGSTFTLALRPAPQTT